MKKDSTHRTPNYAGWAGLEGIDLKKDIEQLEHIEHDIEHIKEALYDTGRVLNHAYHHEEEEPQVKDNAKIQEKIYDLHNEIVNMIIMFCKYNDILPQMVSFNVDMLAPSIEAGMWTAATDSSLVFCADNNFDNIMFESV